MSGNESIPTEVRHTSSKTLSPLITDPAFHRNSSSFFPFSRELTEAILFLCTPSFSLSVMSSKVFYIIACVQIFFYPQFAHKVMGFITTL